MRRVLSTLTLLLALISCGSSDDDDSSDDIQQAENGGRTSPAANITYDAEMSPQERRALDESTSSMNSFVIDGSNIRWFTEIFGGTTSANVVNYVDQRVNYAVSASTDLTSRLIFDSASMDLSSLQIFALNPSLRLWLVALAAPGTTLDINNNQVDINSTRIGVMQFGDIFVTSDTATQAITLVHEARHSDCSGGLSSGDVEEFRNSGDLPSDKKCAYLHQVCPPGHPLAGLVACDTHPWGAYVIDAIYSLAIAENCISCTVTQKQAAEINFFEVINRPLFLEELLNGEFGPPDMSSSNIVR